MSHVVLLISPEQIKEMKSHYSSSLASKLPPGSIFSAKPPLCTVTAYKSGKVLFQGKNAELEAVKWQKGSTAAAPKKKRHPLHQSRPIDIRRLQISERCQ